ncbi:MAG: methyltransferase domain-containing protein [Deltaproteobacteria bacterium]|nr:methyltransferase domain-containing protein [Deltaproteobacteria bacterium]
MGPIEESTYGKDGLFRGRVHGDADLRALGASMTSSWSDLSTHRRRVRDRFGDIYRLPIRYRARDIVLAELHDGQRCLEVGAGDRRMKQRILSRFPRVSYESMDVDERGAHEYKSLDEVKGAYDCIFSLEVVEHLTLDEIERWLLRLSELLSPGGILILTTPNVYHPPAFLRDATHRTPLAHDELGGLLEAAGFTVEHIFRIHYAPPLRRLAVRFCFGWLFRLLGLDFARQILAIARVPAKDRARTVVPCRASS